MLRSEGLQMLSSFRPGNIVAVALGVRKVEVEVLEVDEQDAFPVSVPEGILSCLITVLLCEELSVVDIRWDIGGLPLSLDEW